MPTNAQFQEKYKLLLPHLDEKSARLFLASEAISLGRGAKVRIAKLAGISQVRINRGIKELESYVKPPIKEKGVRIWKAGGGRKAYMGMHPGLDEAIEKIVSPHTLGDPMNPL